MSSRETRRLELRMAFLVADIGLDNGQATALSHLAMQRLDQYAADMRDTLARDDTIRAGARGDCSLPDPCDTCLSTTRRVLDAVRIHLSGRSL